MSTLYGVYVFSGMAYVVQLWLLGSVFRFPMLRMFFLDMKGLTVINGNKVEKSGVKGK